MRSLKKAVAYGILLWLLPFIVSLVIYPIHGSDRPLFESIMPVVLAFFCVVFALGYFRHVGKNHAKEGLYLGILWLVISIVIDFVVFLQFFQLTLANYMSDIGLVYLMYPVITAGIGHALQRAAKPKSMRRGREKRFSPF